MRKLALLAMGLVVGGVSMLADPVTTIKQQEFSISQAEAFGRSAGRSRGGARRGAARSGARSTARRTSRRIHRRVNRRHNYYRSLPRGCVRITLSGIRYWDCGSLYYRSIIEAGETVYIIVTP